MENRVKWVVTETKDGLDRLAVAEGRMIEVEKNEIARKLRETDTWDMDLLKELCELAGMEAEWEAADGDTFEAVAYAAAEKLGVEI